MLFCFFLLLLLLLTFQTNRFNSQGQSDIGHKGQVCILHIKNLSLPVLIGNAEIFDNVNVPFHKVDDDWCLDREEESRSRLEERGGALDGYIKGWNRWTCNVIIIDTRPML